MESRNHTPPALLHRIRYDSGCPSALDDSVVGLRHWAVALAASTYQLALSMLMASRDAVSTVSQDPVAIIATIDGCLHTLTTASPWKVSHAVLILCCVYSGTVYVCLFAFNATVHIFHAWVSFNRALPHRLEEWVISLLRLAVTLLPLLLDGLTLLFVIAAFGCLTTLHGIPMAWRFMHRVKTPARGHDTIHNGFLPSHTKNGHLVKPQMGATYVMVSPKAWRYTSSVPQKKVSFLDDQAFDNITNLHLASGKSVNDNGDHRSGLALQAYEIRRLRGCLQEERQRNREFVGTGAEMEGYRRGLAAEQGRCSLLQLQLRQLRAEMGAEGHPLERDYRESQDKIQMLLAKQTEVKRERDEMEKSSLGFLDEIAKLKKQLKGINKVHQCQMDKLRKRLIAAEAKLATSEQEAAQYRQHRHVLAAIDDELKSAEAEVRDDRTSEPRREYKDKQPATATMI